MRSGCGIRSTMYHASCTTSSARSRSPTRRTARFLTLGSAVIARSSRSKFSRRKPADRSGGLRLVTEGPPLLQMLPSPWAAAVWVLSAPAGRRRRQVKPEQCCPGQVPGPAISTASVDPQPARSQSGQFPSFSHFREMAETSVICRNRGKSTCRMVGQLTVRSSRERSCNGSPARLGSRRSNVGRTDTKSEDVGHRRLTRETPTRTPLLTVPRRATQAG